MNLIAAADKISLIFYTRVKDETERVNINNICILSGESACFQLKAITTLKR